MSGGGGGDGFVNNDDFGGDMGPPDMVPRKGFGEPCNDKSECETEICIFTGTGGVCSRLCPPACPMDYGCFGVLGGGIDPGAVVDVCVPITTQLCTPCTMATECSVGGKDLCLPAATGGTFCGRDCSKISCPMGYQCQDVTQGGNTFKQCIPNSGSCDCNSAANMGVMQTCPITTPFGTCNGTRTCMGLTGWGACAPPSMTDVPDGNFADENCDGIDGKIAEGIYVAKTGTDNSTCGLDHLTPCLTISGGILRANDESRKYVYVQAGTYNEVVVMQSGKHVFGGYDTMWKRASRTTAGHEVRIVGLLDNAEGEYMAVKAHNITGTLATTLADVVIQAPTPPGTSFGKSSYGVHAVNAKLSLQRVTVIGGDGIRGTTGSNGGAATTGTGATAGMTGSGGGNASYSDNPLTCDPNGAGGGGGGGGNNCDGTLTDGGIGGKGGPRDSSCGWCGLCECVCCGNGNCNSQGASSGGTGFNNGGAGGGAGPAGGSCGPANQQDNWGGNGRVSNGGAGSAGDADGAMGGTNNNYWYARGGGTGNLGLHGGGGGGGGGSGGCDDGIGDSYGAGGGGGGAGGCRAASGGGGGGGGGGSFAVFATAASTIDATSCDIQRGNGADGGNAGRGGRGQDGGSGVNGGNPDGGSKAGGRGGNGGHGGHSGGGAGGSGGISAAFFNRGSSITQSCTINGGSSGGGGSGGAIPSGVSDGNAGPNGPGGGAARTVFTCNSAGDCT
jgi:hypothetical protein